MIVDINDDSIVVVLIVLIVRVVVIVLYDRYIISYDIVDDIVDIYR